MAQSLLLNLTTYCNALCGFCIVYDSLNRPELNMTDEQIFTTIDKAAADGATEIGYSGGEPTVHPRMAEIIRYARDKGFIHQSMNTNGIKFKKEAYCREIIEAGLTSLDFSIHGHTDEIHDNLVARKGALEAIRKGCGHLRELQKEHRFHMSATVVVTRENHQHLKEVCELLTELGTDNKRIKYAYEGNLRSEAIINHVMPYQDVIPSIKDAIEYLVTTQRGFHITHIPLCMMGEHAAFSRDFERRNTLMVFKKEAEVGDEAHHFRRDADECTRCVLRNLCTRLDGAYEEYHGRPDLTAFTSNEEVEALFDRAEDRFPEAVDLVRRTRGMYMRNREAGDPGGVSVEHPSSAT